MRRPGSVHAEHPWRIHEITADFGIEDVWDLPTPGGPDDFPRLLELFGDANPEDGAGVGRILWAVRWKLGELLGWDDPAAGLGGRVPSLRDRLPADLLAAPRGPDLEGVPFEPLYLLEDEFAAEIANRTVHGVLHLGWVAGDDGTHHARMTVLVRPNGIGGRLYMELIKPFRYAIIYPAMLRRIGRDWSAARSPS